MGRSKHQIAKAEVDFLRLEALDNLLVLNGLERFPNIFCDGILIFHRRAPKITRWVNPNDTVESWLEDVKLLAE